MHMQLCFHSDMACTGTKTKKHNLKVNEVQELPDLI